MPYFTHGETKNKLILLYIADRAGAIPTRAQLYRTAILNSDMEYFAFEEALGALLEDGLVAAMFEKSVPENERRKLDEYLDTHRGDFLRETQISSRIEKGESGVTLHLYITEADRTILAVSLAAASEEQAMAMRSRWEEAGEPVYNYIWDILSKENR